MKRTTKAVLIGLATMVAFTMLAGCMEASAKTEKLHYHPRMMNFRNPSLIYIDPETGVQYIVMWMGREMSITPRLDADGKPMVDRSVRK